jgi:hypothetical protein
MDGERRVTTREGLLTFDGRVLEIFPTDGKDNRWRVHAATVVRWELEQRKGCALLKVFTHPKHHRSTLVDDVALPAVRALMAEVDAAR